MSRRADVLIFALIALVLAGPAARAEDRTMSVRDAVRLQRDFEAYCKASAADAPSEEGGKYVVYAYAVFRQRMERDMGDRQIVTPIVWAAVFDSTDRLARARTRYDGLRRFCREKVGLQRFSRFPFEEKTWGYDSFDEAWAHAAGINRKSRLANWPEVLDLANAAPTGAAQYFLFGYRPLSVQLSFDDDCDEDDYELEYRAFKRPWRFCIFDDAEAAEAAERLYKQYIAHWHTVSDGRGNAVGRIEPYVKSFPTYEQARRTERELLTKQLQDPDL